MCVEENLTIPVEQLLPVHPLTHVQLFGEVHSLLIPQTGLQIANKIKVTIVLCVHNSIYQLDNHYQSIQSYKYKCLEQYIPY